MLPLYFGSVERPLFGTYYAPSSGGDTAALRDVAVLVCGPFGHEALHADRALRHLTERLSKAGFATLRFDYDATLDSAGDDREGGRVAAWRESIFVAAETLREKASLTRLVMVGLRAGSLLSVVESGRVGAERLVLWNPVVNGRAHVRELTRLHRMLVPKRKGDDAPSQDEEALGFALSKETAADLGKFDMLGITETPASGALVIGGNDNPTEDKLIEKLQNLGVEVQYKHLPGHPFLVTDPHRNVVPDEMLATVVDYLSACYPSLTPGGGAGLRVDTRRPPARTPHVFRDVRQTAPNAPLSEQAWLFGTPQQRFGILTVPSARADAKKGQKKKPAIVLMNAGSIPHVGPNRSFVRMARRFASFGFPVLRMDLSGIGFSPTVPNEKENIPYPKGAVSDVQAAMRALSEQHIADKFILSGLCSGADIAFRTAVLDPRVVGAWMINPQAFYFQSSDALKAYMDAELQAAYYKNAVWDFERWKRVFRGEVDVIRIMGVMRGKVESAIRRRLPKVLGNTGSTENQTESRSVIDDIRSIAERGGDAFLLCCEDDPGLLYLLKYFRGDFATLDQVRGYRKEIVKGVDHTFTPVWSQDLLSDMLTEHLTRRYGD